METKHNFTKLSPEQFVSWLFSQKVNRKVTKVQQHHTYLPDYSHFTGDNHFARQLSMRDFHVKTKKWEDIAQHFTTFPDGSILTGRSLEKTPVGIYGHNTGAICIEHFGNFDKDEMTAEHREAIIQMTAALCLKFNLNPSIQTIIYHSWYDLSTGKFNLKSKNRKTCPGVNFFGGNKPYACKANFVPLIHTRMLHLIKNN